jgi:demethylmenaquinone methyltransferase/2-methoxy-6-polyprenyl-1,4-benzoquinol methylase
MKQEEGRCSEPAWTAADLRADPHEAPDKADRVRRMFQAIAPRYDLNNRLHSLGRDRAWRRCAVEMARVRRGDRVLDAACGTGDLAIAFARAGAGQVVGVDFTQAMLDLARRKAAKLGAIASRLLFNQADVTSLPFEDESFDIVSIAFGLRNVDDSQRALREFARVLRPGGRIVILEFSTPRNPIIRAINSFYCHRIMPLTATLISRDRSGAYRYLPRSVESFAGPGELAAMLRDAGCTRIETRWLTFGVCAVTVGTAGGRHTGTGTAMGATPF